MKIRPRYISSVAVLGGTLLALCAVSVDASAEAPAPALAPTPSAGEAILYRACVNCHDMGKITGKRLSAEQWEQSVYRMMSLGVALTDEEAAALIEYLAKTYPEEKH